MLQQHRFIIILTRQAFLVKIYCQIYSQTFADPLRNYEDLDVHAVPTT